MTYDAQHLLDVLADQRNKALNELAEAKALCLTQAKRISELEAQIPKKDESNGV